MAGQRAELAARPVTVSRTRLRDRRLLLVEREAARRLASARRLARRRRLSTSAQICDLLGAGEADVAGSARR